MQYPLCRQQAFPEIGSIPDAWCTYSFHSSAPVTARMPLITIYSDPKTRIFPYQIIFLNNNSAQNCLTQCSTYGYPAAGMEYGDECCMYSTAVECSWCRLWKRHSLGCGDVADISNNGGVTAPETDCNMTCSGDSSHLCGGFYRLQLYLWKGTLNNWQTPSNIGRYEVCTKIPFFIHAQARYNFISVPRPRPRTSSACYGRYKRQGVLPREIHDVRVQKLYWRIRTRLEFGQRF